MIELENFRKNPSLLAVYSQAINNLKQIGFIDYLRAMNSFLSPAKGESLEQSALNGARSAGYFQAINDILFFEEEYNKLYGQNPNNSKLVPDYGALDKLVSEGIITQAEADIQRKELKKGS